MGRKSDKSKEKKKQRKEESAKMVVSRAKVDKANKLQMSVVNLNTCSFQELLQLPGIGIKTGEQIMDIRESKGFVTESDLATISHLRVTRGLLSRLDFSPNGGGQNIGPPPQAQGRHGEMLDMGHIAPQGTPSQFKPGDANARPEPTGNWDGGYREQLQKKEWSHHDIGDPNQGSPPHHMYRGSIGNKPYWPGKDSAWDKLTPNYWGTPSHPIGHASNYAGQGSAPCTQPAYTGGGQYEMACSKYGKGQDNRGADTRQTPSHDNGDRQPKNQYNQGYTAVLPQGVTAGVGYGQQAYPVPYNEDRPIENTRGPDNRGGARGTLGGISKVTNAPKNIKYDGKGNWQAFFTKFARYAQRELVEKLHKRFGFKALPETAQVQFNNARQAPEESLEDWADRVLSLATRAFRNLPDDYMYEQAVMRLCQGIENKTPQSIEEAIDKIRLFQHNTQAIYGKPNRREVRQVTDGQYGDHHEAFREYQGPHVRDTMALERAPVSTWKVELEKSDKKFENKLGQVHEKLDDMMDQFKQLLTSPIAGSCLPGRQTGTESCHHCGERGHSKMECPNYRDKSVSGVPPLIEGLHGRECATIVLSLDMLRRTVWIYRRGIELLPPQFSQAEQQQDH
ncbi:Hypothetical predicted protein [Mytilus galloprovincialis]|uniref:CCHC-type domain-containing protein n=1 Tax=Mytilus galloprovincialis TaxID=29158 RepID=A0A8B6F640_MYTGA|nr:Hypothetical predicted protein [Mytilus galloprovincialis]